MMVQTEIGLLPEDWEVKRIGDFFDFKNGLNKSKEFFGYGIPIVNYTDVYKNKSLRTKDIKGKVDLSREEINRYRTKKGDVFFTRTSETPEEVGFASVLLDDIQDCVFSGFVLRARPKNDRLYPEYCGYSFTTKNVRSSIIASCSYTTRALTNGTLLSAIQIPVPPTTEQQNIASALSSIDKLIDDLGRTIQKKQRIREGAMEELLSGKKRLPGFTEEWVEKKIGEVCNTASGGTPSRSNPKYYTGKIKWFTTAELNDGWLLDSMEHISEEAIKNSSAKIFKEGTLLMAMYGATIGKLGILSSEAATNQACCAFESKEMDIIFLFYFLFAKRQQILSLGAGAGQPNICQQIIKNIPINIPPIKEQHAIADILTSMDDEISLLESERAKYEQIRSGMMEELLTGKKRLIKK